MQKEEISNIVREVLKERGLLDNSKSKPDPKRIRRSRTAPAVLNVFHAGIRKLEQALEQVRLIEQTAGRSSVFTVNSARSWVCGADVKEKAGTRCILDTVRPEGLEKALEKSDILVLPTFCFKTAAKAARMINDDQETAIVISALIQGKPVLATRDGFTLLESLSNKNIREEIKRILDKLEGFGITFCETDQLFSVFQKIVVDKKNTESPTAKPQAGNETPSALRLITAKDILTAVNSNHDSIQLAPGGMVTPLARDQAKEYSITIVKTSS
jgi:gamma-glutamyl-gamma-aminobutyrate hydrolase PuuD